MPAKCHRVREHLPHAEVAKLLDALKRDRTAIGIGSSRGNDPELAPTRFKSLFRD